MSSAAPGNPKVKAMRETDAMARKRMRKGTRSCLQCRSRKVRCTYPPNSHVCHGCLTHGRACTEQTYQDVKNGGLDKRIGLKERVRELETLVQQLVERGGADAKEIEERMRKAKQQDGSPAGGFLSPPDSTGGKDGSPSEPPTEYHGDEDDDESHDEYEDDLDHPTDETADFQKAPLMSLLNNDLLQTSYETSYPIRSAASKPVSNAKAAKNAKVLEEFRALLPSMDAIKTLLARSGHMLFIFADLMFHRRDFDADEIEKRLHESSSSDRPIEVIKTVLFLTVLVQQSDADSFQHDRSILRGLSQVAFIRKNTDTVEHHLCSSNSMMSSLDGLEAALMLCKIQVNDARPRKAWLLIQRSLSYCRLLGFHRSTSWKTPEDTNIGGRRQLVWWHLFFSDRGISLLLGLPYSTVGAHVEFEINLVLKDNMHFSAGSPQGVSPVEIKLWTHLALIAGRVIDRNQDPRLEVTTSFAETMKIDGELHELEHTMPREWWALSEESEEYQTAYSKMPVYEVLESSMIQTFCHEARIALHMPFMMRNAQDGRFKGQYEHSRVMATSSARAMIRCHLRIRSRPDMINMVCQIVDFQVFNATVLLILDMLLRSRGRGKEFWEDRDEQTISDLSLIKDAYWMLRNISTKCVARANVPAQAVKVLETLGYLVRGCAVPGLDKHNRRIVIPYFGAITIKPSKALQEHVQSIPSDTDCDCATMVSAAGGATPTQKPTSLPSAAPESPTNMLTPSSTASQSMASSATHTPDMSRPLEQPANDFTFNPFSAPQEEVIFVPPAPNQLGQGLESLMPGAPSLPLYQSDEGLEGYVPALGNETFDAPMWDDGQWQQMLLDPSLDLDNANWGFFPVEGTA